MGHAQQPRRRSWARWALIGLNIAFLGCARVQHDAEAPTPRLGDLQLPRRVTMGCPARLTVTFDAADGGNLRGDLRLVRRSSRGRETRQMMLDYDPDTGSRGQAWTQLTLTQPDVYWVYVQMADDHGHKSNVVKRGLIVDGTRPWKREQCE